MISLLCSGILLVALSTPITFLAYRQYEAENTYTYGHELKLYPNGTAGDAVIVPIPEEEDLLAGLHVMSGVANWSIANTSHGRGLYVAFVGYASLEAEYSAYGPSRFDHNNTPTMRENVSSFQADAWIYRAASSEVRVDLSIGWCRLGAFPAEGWRTYRMVCVPPP